MSSGIYVPRIRTQRGIANDVIQLFTDWDFTLEQQKSHNMRQSILTTDLHQTVPIRHGSARPDPAAIRLDLDFLDEPR
jgi:hypothetical protein